MDTTTHMVILAGDSCQTCYENPSSGELLNMRGSVDAGTGYIRDSAAFLRYSNSMMQGIDAEDQVCVGDVCLGAQPIFVVDKELNDTTALMNRPLNGILGLARPEKVRLLNKYVGSDYVLEH